MLTHILFVICLCMLWLALAMKSNALLFAILHVVQMFVVISIRSSLSLKDEGASNSAYSQRKRHNSNMADIS